MARALSLHESGRYANTVGDSNCPDIPDWGWENVFGSEDTDPRQRSADPERTWIEIDDVSLEHLHQGYVMMTTRTDEENDYDFDDEEEDPYAIMASEVTHHDTETTYDRYLRAVPTDFQDLWGINGMTVNASEAQDAFDAITVAEKITRNNGWHDRVHSTQRRGVSIILNRPQIQQASDRLGDLKEFLRDRQVDDSSWEAPIWMEKHYVYSSWLDYSVFRGYRVAGPLSQEEITIWRSMTPRERKFCRGDVREDDMIPNPIRARRNRRQTWKATRRTQWRPCA